MAVPNLSELITTTQRHRTGKLADNVSKQTALLSRLKKKGNNKLVSGGRTLVQELDFQENGTFMYFSGYEEFDISPSEVVSAAEFNWKQAVVSTSMSGLEMLQNSGKEQVIDLLEARMTNADRTMMNKISTGVYSDGTGTGGKQIGGIQLLIADSPATGTVGGIDRATWTFWRNISFDASDAGAAASATNIQSYMNRVWVQICRGPDKPDLIVADNNYWRFYLESLQAIQRFTSDEMASAGFTSVKYMDADVVLDGGVSGDCPTDHMYFVNTNYIFFKTHRDYNFVPADPKKRWAINQDAIVQPLLWAGNMTMSCAFLQGVLKA